MEQMHIKDRAWQYILIITVVFSTLFYVLVTGHIWEDFFITFKHSQNLVEGAGLVYHPGEYVQGFTSVINTLLPALYYWVSGSSLDVTLWLYRISSILALLFGYWFFIKELAKDQERTLMVLFFSFLIAFPVKTVMFTTNGQEAGFMMLFLLPAMVLAFNGIQHNWKWLGICWAGLFYTRPDAVVYVVFMVISALFFGKYRNKAELQGIVKAGIVLTLLYLPWFIGVWVYYGSPVPHTVYAKASLGVSIFADVNFPGPSIFANIPYAGSLSFGPTYFFMGGWPYWVSVFTFTAWFVAFIYWIVPSTDRFGRYVSLIYSFLILYFSYIQYRGGVFPWYFPPVEIMGTFILLSALFQLGKKIGLKHRVKVLSFGGVAITVLYLLIYFMSVKQIKVQQEVIENGNRTSVGIWLKGNIKPGDRIFLEPLGYIGYFSGGKMLDWPGLVSPEVVKVDPHKKRAQYQKVIGKLKPEWLVLRPFEKVGLSKLPWFNSEYSQVKVFDVRRKILEYGELPGINYLYVDSVFIIFKRQTG